MGQSRRPVMSWLMPRSSFPLAVSRVLWEVPVEEVQLLSHSAMTIFSRLVSSLRASFAPVCN